MTSEGEVSQPAPQSNRRTRRWSAGAGALIGLTGSAFVARMLYLGRDDIAEALSNARPGLLIIAVVLVGCAMTGIGLAWRASVQALGGAIGVASSLRGYFVGQLGKYVPGGVWAVVGRAEWARSEGVPTGIAYSSVFLSIGSAFLAAIMLASIAFPVSGFAGSDGDGRYLLILMLLPVGLVLLNPVVLEAVLRILRRLTNRDLDIQVPSWRVSTFIVVRQLPSWLLIGSASWVIAAAFGTSGNLANIVFAAAVSWVIGFIALPVPGGIGVREVAFVALATSLPTGVAAIVAVVARLATILVDAAGAASMAVFVGRQSRNSKQR